MTPWWQWTKTSWRFSFFLAIIGFVSLLKEVLCLFLLISKRSWDKFRVNFTCFSRFYLYYVGIIQRDAEPSPKSPYVLSNIRPTTTTTTSIQHYLRHVWPWSFMPVTDITGWYNQFFFCNILSCHLESIISSILDFFSVIGLCLHLFGYRLIDQKMPGSSLCNHFKNINLDI